jgi:hypothetical protein
MLAAGWVCIVNEQTKSLANPNKKLPLTLHYISGLDFTHDFFLRCSQPVSHSRLTSLSKKD